MPRRAMVPADQEDRVAKVEEGEIIRFPGGALQETTPAGPKCDLNAGAWYCATHREGFQSQIQKDIHIHNQSVKHRLAWMCFSHGPEVP